MEVRHVLVWAMFHDHRCVIATVENSAAVGGESETLSVMNRLLQARINGQSGLVTRAQALDGGLTGRAIDWKVERGLWTRVHSGVYLTTPGRDDWGLRAVAALLKAGPGSALHGRSAGFAWGLVTSAPSHIEVVIPASRRVRPVEGVVIRRSRLVAARVHPTEWPHRIDAEHTVLDLAARSDFDRLVGLTVKALQLKIAAAESLRAALAQRRGFDFRAELDAALTDVAEGAESPAEVRYLRDVEQAHGLPAGVRQIPIDGGAGRRDVEYDEWGLIVEVDGRLGHTGWGARQGEGRRDRKAATTGRLTVRCHWVDLVPAGCELAADLALILSRRGWRGRPRRCGDPCVVADESAA